MYRQVLCLTERHDHQNQLPTQSSYGGPPKRRQAQTCAGRVSADSKLYLADAVLGCLTPTGRLAGKHIKWTYGCNRDQRHKTTVLVVRLHIPQCGALRPEDNHNTWHPSPLSYNLCWPPCGEYTNTDAQPMQVPFTCESIHL